MPTAVAHWPMVVSEEVFFRSEYANPSNPRLLMGDGVQKTPVLNSTFVFKIKPLVIKE